MSESKHTEVIDIDGKKGHSLLYEVKQNIINQETVAPLMAQLNSYLQKYDQISDNRALAIVAALSIEEELDALLSKWIVGYKNISDKADFTFSFKIDLALSVNIIPAKILNAIDPIRKIRNIFAHNLNIDTFEQARKYDEGKKDPIFPKLYYKIRTFQPWDNTNDSYTFRHLAFNIILGLYVYGLYVDKIREFLWKEENIEKIVRNK